VHACWLNANLANKNTYFTINFTLLCDTYSTADTVLSHCVHLRRILITDKSISGIPITPVGIPWEWEVLL